MKKFAHIASTLTLAAVLSASPAFASGKGNKGKPNKGKPVSFKSALAPDPALTDLSTATGRLEFSAKKFMQLKARITVPLGSTSLAIADATAAAAANIHVEFKRADAIIADCSFAFLPEDDSTPDETATTAQFRLFVKTNGKHDVKGTCGNGTVPALQPTDTAVVYAIVGGTTRIDFMSK
jgi:hypothetical protein